MTYRRRPPTPPQLQAQSGPQQHGIRSGLAAIYARDGLHGVCGYLCGCVCAGKEESSYSTPTAPIAPDTAPPR